MNDVQDVCVSRPMRRWLSVWFATLLIAFALDGAAAHWSQPVAQRVKHSEVSEELKEAGHIGSVLVIAAFVYVLHESRGRGVALLLGSAVACGLFYTIVRWTVGRTRPVVRIKPYHFEPFANGLEGFLHAHNMSFPSGHVCLAFATAACLAHLLPRGRWLFFGIAAALAAQRVLELAHYPSDVVAAAGLGVLAFAVTRRAQEALLARRPHRLTGPSAAAPTAPAGSSVNA